MSSEYSIFSARCTIEINIYRVFSTNTRNCIWIEIVHQSDAVCLQCFVTCVFRYHIWPCLLCQHSEILIQNKCHRIRKLKIKWKLIIILDALQVLRVRSTHLFICSLFMSSFYSLYSAKYCLLQIVLPSLPKSCATNINFVWTNTRLGWLYWNLNSTISLWCQRDFCMQKLSSLRHRNHYFQRHIHIHCVCVCVY